MPDPEKFVLTITAEGDPSIEPEDPDFDGMNYKKPKQCSVKEVYYSDRNGNRKFSLKHPPSNKTLPQLAIEVFKTQLEEFVEDENKEKERREFPTMKNSDKGIRQIKGIEDRTSFIPIGKNYGIIYEGIFPMIPFVKACLIKFGDGNDKFVLTYEKETKNIGNDTKDSKELINTEVDYNMKAINRIYYGAPGTGKSWEVKEYGEKHFNKSWRTTFHPEYTYFDFVGGLKPIQKKGEDGKEDRISYEYYSGPFADALLYAYENPDKKVGLIIEEINRANTAAVFGDIFQLLDRDDAGQSEYVIYNKELLEFLTSNGNGVNTPNNEIRIPSNLSIIATMNSADQGVFVMDSAFKRRWEFVYVPIDFKMHLDIGKQEVAGFDKITWQDFAEGLNKYLADTLEIPEDKLIGPRFLKKSEIINKDKIASKLLIYLWDDVVRYKRNELFLKSSRFSEVVEDFKHGKPIFNKNVQDILKLPTENNDINTSTEDSL